MSTVQKVKPSPYRGKVPPLSKPATAPPPEVSNDTSTPKVVPPPPSPPPKDSAKDYLAAAKIWFAFGFKVYPVLPGTKRPALKLESWTANLSLQSIKAYWAKHPDHEVGFITGDNIVVLDADTPESIQVLQNIEESHNIKPNLISKTRKGEHHFFRILPKTYAKSDSHCSTQYPKRIDVKTGGGQIILPPSTDKTVALKEANNIDELAIASQEFIDSVFLMNDRGVPRPPEPVAKENRKMVSTDEEAINKCLENISPDIGYQDWLRVGMAIFHETNGSDGGLKIFDQWSAKGKKYNGIKDIETKWRSFRLDVTNPVTIGSLLKMAKDAGADIEIIKQNAEKFEPCTPDLVKPDHATPEKKVKNPLDMYSLRGLSDEIEKQSVEGVYVLNQIALLGQSTVIYAAPNIGKTLLTIKMLVQSIKNEQIFPTNIYYINVDDTTSGLVDKLRIAEEYKFNILAEGYRGFKSADLLAKFTELIQSGNTKGVIIVLDTLKKFTDLMDKKLCREFGMTIRQFIVKGGTVISLAHTNKNRGRDGKRVQAGSSDILDDSDCAYILDIVSEDAENKIVEFTNIKKRGNVANSVSYRYSVEPGISYNELLLSVEQVDPEQIIPLKQAAETLSDAELISVIEDCIKNGINTKMKLAEMAADRAKASRRRALNVIEKYTGDDPGKHRWYFEVHERGAKVYVTHTPPGDPSAAPEIVSL